MVEPSGPEFLVNMTTESFQRTWEESPRAIALDADGDFVVTWSSYGQDGSNYGVYARLYNAAGEPQTDEFLVNSTTFEVQLYSTVAMDDDGDFVIAWSSYGQDGDGYGVYFQRYDAAGTPIGGETRANTATDSDQTRPSIAMNSAGDFVIAWESLGQDGSGRGVYAKKFTAGGLGDEFRVNTTTANDQGAPSVAIDDTGAFVVAWSSAGQDGSGSGVFARRYNAGGAPVSGEFAVNTVTSGDQSSVGVASDASGNFVVTWASANQDGSGLGVYARRYDSAGAPQDTEEFLVNTNTVGDQGTPSISMAGGGQFVIAWSSANQDGNGLGVYGQVFNADGSRDDSEFRINTTTADDQRFPSIAMDGQGDFVAVWSSYGQAPDSSRYGVFAQRYAPNRSPVADPGGPYVVDEGQGLLLDGSGSLDPDGDPVTILWELDGDDDFDDATGPQVQLSLQDLLAIDASLNDGDSALFPVKVRVDDGRGHIVESEPTTIQVVNVAPTINLSGSSQTDQGTAYGLTLGAITDPGPDTVTSWTVNWGDGTSETFDSGGLKTHVYAATGQMNISVDLIDEDGIHQSAGTHVVNVSDIGPTIELTGPDQVNEGSAYSLTLGDIVDPGGNTVTKIIVNWGDGTSAEVSPGSQPAPHVYADGNEQLNITIDIEDEGGRHNGVAAKLVTVLDVVPTINLAGLPSVDEGGAFTLMLGEITDPGQDTAQNLIIDWGDGSTPQSVVAGTPQVSHTYVDGPLSTVISVSVQDEDDTHIGAGTHAVSVNNIVPVLTIDGPDQVDEGVTYDLTLSDIVDPGTDTATHWIVNWGDGTSDEFTSGGTHSHVFRRSGANTISVTIRDDDGDHVSVATHTVNVSDVSPSIAVSGPTEVNEGSSYQLDLGTIDDPGDDVVTAWIVHWGDGTTDTFSSGGAKTHVYADDASELQVTVDLMDADGTHANAGGATVSVRNVAPTIDMVAPGSVSEGQPFFLSLGSINDPGDDTVTGILVDWGDGTQDAFNSSGLKQHAYTEDGQRTIRVDLIDEDGTHVGGTRNITVRNFSPRIELFGAAQSDEGSMYELMLGEVVDPGEDTVTEWTIDWGDGTVESFNSGEGRQHFYADNGDYSIRVSLTDEDGTHAGAGQAQVSINNVAPLVGLSGPARVSQGAPFALTIGEVVDPGDDLVSQWIVNWGDGSQETFSSGGVKEHVYSNGTGTNEITVALVDEDGNHPNAGVFSVRVSIPGDSNGDRSVDLSDFNTLKGNFGSEGTIEEGDANGDSQVDLADFNLLKGNFGSREPDETVPGDADGDGQVGLSDFNILKSNFGQPGDPSQGDFDGSGAVGLADFNILKENFGSSAAIGSQARVEVHRDSEWQLLVDEVLLALGEDSQDPPPKDLKS